MSTTTTTKPALAIGQRWLTAAGYEAYIESSEPRPHSFWHVNLFGIPESDSWIRTLYYDDDGIAPATSSDYTLTTLLPKLSVGQRWRTRDGEVVEVMTYTPDDPMGDRWPYRCSNDIRYTREGFQLGNSVEGHRDLVEYLGNGDEPSANATPEAAPQQPVPPRFTSAVPLSTGGAYAIAEDGSLWHLSGRRALRVAAQE